jgi:general secretion pathway protein I
VRSHAAGFTLIEVLVALAIVAIGMMAVLEAITSSANTVAYLRDKTLAEWVGLNQIATTRLGLQPGQVPPTDTTNGDLDYAGRSWHWRQEVTALQVKGLVRIDVKVRPGDVKGGDDNGWYATVSGVAGDALARPTGNTPLWGDGGLPGQCTPPGNPSCNANGGNLDPNNASEPLKNPNQTNSPTPTPNSGAGGNPSPNPRSPIGPQSPGGNP